MELFLDLLRSVVYGVIEGITERQSPPPRARGR